MNTFEELHKAQVGGSLTTFDRMIFKGHLTGLFPAGSFERLLSQSALLLKNFGAFAEAATAEVKDHVQRLAAEAGRPLQYLQERTTKRSGRSTDTWPERPPSVTA